MTRPCNKFGVPYHGYTLALADATLDPRAWAEDRVWPWSENYSG